MFRLDFGAVATSKCGQGLCQYGSTGLSRRGAVLLGEPLFWVSEGNRLSSGAVFVEQTFVITQGLRSVMCLAI